MKQKIKYTILYGFVLLVLAYNLYIVLQLDKELKEGFISESEWTAFGIGIAAGAVITIIALVLYLNSDSSKD